MKTSNIDFLGADTVRFKAEINFDGREITRVHLDRSDLDMLLKVSFNKKLLHLLRAKI